MIFPSIIHLFTQQLSLLGAYFVAHIVINME